MLCKPVVTLAILLTFAPTSWATEFTGVWKRNCSDYYGVKIEPAAAGLYSVSFCGYGCFAPGTWMPNTSIVSDAHYKIVSPSRLGIRRDDNPDKFFFYKLCSKDPTW